MELLLKRQSTGDESTIGTLHEIVDETPYGGHAEFLAFTMEDQPNEPKIRGETRIPAGRYQIKLRTEGGMHGRYGNKFSWHQGMIWLQDVPNFQWVYIHYGNYEKDTDGCILVGNGAQSNLAEDGMVQASVAAYTRIAEQIYEALDMNDEVWITVEDYA